MATAKKSTPPPAPPPTYADLDDEARYEVDLAKPIRVGRAWARPGTHVELKGRLVKEHAENVVAVRPLAG